MQIIFMEALGGIFKVQGQTWKEWLFAVAVGAGSMPVAVIIKFFARMIHKRRDPSADSNARNAVQAL